MTIADTTSSPTAEIVLRRVLIRNFRALHELSLELEPSTTYLVGENNSGKTSLLLALWTALGSRRPVRDDLRREADGTPAVEATIDLFLSPAEGAVFADPIRQRLLAVHRDPDSGAETVGLRVTLLPSHEGSFLGTRRSFLQPTADGSWEAAIAPALPPNFMLLLDAQYLDASRDLVGELGNRTSSWGRVLSDLRIIDDDSEHGRKNIELALAQVAKLVRDASPVLTSLETDLGGLVDSIPSVNAVELQPLPPRLEEIVRTAEVLIRQAGDPALPIRFHGSGSRSLAALLVFQTLATIRLGADQGTRPQLLTLLEEPEAHLHPQSITALQALIDRLPGQRVVSTHSSRLVSVVHPSSVRLLRRKDGMMRVVTLPPATAKRVNQFRRFVERPYGEVLFARAVVFADGATERCALPVLLGGHFKCDPAGLGISFIDCQSMTAEHTGMLVRAAHDLGVDWLIFADNDGPGLAAVAAMDHPEGGKLDSNSSEVVLSGSKQIEQLLIDAGYALEIETVANSVGTPIGATLTHLDFLVRNKPWVAEHVAIEALAANRALPACIVDLGQRLSTRLGLAST